MAVIVTSVILCLINLILWIVLAIRFKKIFSTEEIIDKTKESFIDDNIVLAYRIEPLEEIIDNLIEDKALYKKYALKFDELKRLNKDDILMKLVKQKNLLDLPQVNKLEHNFSLEIKLV